MKILVIGAAGVLGRQICARVVKRFGVEALVVGDYQAERAGRLRDEFSTPKASCSVRVIDVADAGSITVGIEGMSFAIVATAQTSPRVQTECLRQGIPSLDLSVDPDFLQQCRQLTQEATDQPLQLVAAGLFPGLSGVMAQHIHRLSPPNEPVDVALLQSVNGTHGAAGAVDMMRILAAPVTVLTDTSADEVDRELPGFSRSKTMTFAPPIGDRTVRQAAFVEQTLLEQQGVRSNFWTGFDSRRFTALVVAARRTGLLRCFRSKRFAERVGPRLVAHPDNDRSEVIGLTASSASHLLSYTLTSDYGATAACAVAMAVLVLSESAAGPRLGAGVRFPFEVFGLDDLEPEIADVRVDIEVRQ